MIGQAGVLKQKLLEKITELPEARLQEVLDFVDFFKSRKPRVEDPILHVSSP